jgi:hypothetical protein
MYNMLSFYPGHKNNKVKIYRSSTEEARYTFIYHRHQQENLSVFELGDAEVGDAPTGLPLCEPSWNLRFIA